MVLAFGCRDMIDQIRLVYFSARTAVATWVRLCSMHPELLKARMAQSAFTVPAMVERTRLVTKSRVVLKLLKHETYKRPMTPELLAFVMQMSFLGIGMHTNLVGCRERLCI